MAKLQCDAAVAYYYVKSSNVLHAVGAAPDFRSRGSKRQVPAHQGVQGAVFTSGIALSLSSIDDDTRGLYFKDRKEIMEYSVDNVAVFPIRAGGTSIGVVECINKRGGNLTWSPTDESFICSAATMLSHLMQYCNVNFATAPVFVPSALRNIRQLSTLHDSGLDITEFELDSLSSQLVLRDELSGGGSLRADKAQSITTPNLKEVHSYLTNLELSYRNGLNTVVVTDKEVTTLQEELTKRNHRIRLLEENINYLNDQLVAVRTRVSPHFAPVPGHDLNFRNYTDTKEKTEKKLTMREAVTMATTANGFADILNPKPAKLAPLPRQGHTSSVAPTLGGGLTRNLRPSRDPKAFGKRK